MFKESELNKLDEESQVHFRAIMDFAKGSREYKHTRPKSSLNVGDKMPILASLSRGGYTVAITDLPDNHPSLHYGLKLLQRDSDKTTVWTGFWMDFTESHWDITHEDYYKLPREDRAMMEVEEQLNNWVNDEYAAERFKETDRLVKSIEMGYMNARRRWVK